MTSAKKRETIWDRFELDYVSVLPVLDDCMGWFISISENTQKYYSHIPCRNRYLRLSVYYFKKG